MLNQIEGREASQALARRAIFDVEDSVRVAAREALKNRERGDYGDVLARGSNFPLASTVELAELATREACAGSTTSKRALLGDNCVSRPYVQAKGDWVVDELVKVNHLRNCMLCHPASTNTSDPLRGPIPQPGQELPRVYYSQTKGNFVRADVVYIRQDFSVMLPVENAQPWPAMQRYDFFVRTRPAMATELADEVLRRERVKVWIDSITLVVREELARWQSVLAAG
jgi:hypothetical protein